MTWLSKLLFYLRSLFTRQKQDEQLSEEMRTHVEMAMAANVARGMSLEEARYAALREFGNMASLRERTRDERGWAWLDQLQQDVRYALRQIAKSPGFAAVVVLTLAFGIAVNSSLFDIINVMLLRKSPLPEPDRLAVFLQRSDVIKVPHGISYPDYHDYRERLRTVDGLMAFMPSPANLAANGGAPLRTWVEIVSPNAFAAIGVPAARGRTLLPSDGENKGGAPVTVLSHDCWVNQFGSDPGIVGRVIQLNGKPFTVVGIGPEGFHGFSYMMAMSAFIPASALDTFRPSAAGMLEWRGAPAWRVTGRLRAGSSVRDADAEAAVVLDQLAREYPESHRNYRSLVIPESRARPDPAVTDYLPVFLGLFFGLVLLVLSIACANVANLMIARAVTRQRELTVRAALGAGRGRLIRQLLAESMVLALIAGVVGWFLATGLGVLLSRFIPQGDIPLAVDFSPGWRNYVFTGAISLAAGLVSGILPALRASRIDLVAQLKAGHDDALAAGRHRVRNLLVAGQVTLSLVVLICAGLFLQSLHKVKTVDLGFRSDHLMMLSFDLALQGYADDRSRNFNAALLEHVRAIPGVQAAGLTSHMPFDNQLNARDVHPEVPPPAMKDGTTAVKITHVSPGFLETLGVRLRQGRLLTLADRADGPRVAVINAAMAELCWPGQDAVGKRFQPWKDGPWIEVVGVTETAKYLMLAEAPSPVFFMSLAQEFQTPVTLVVRTSVEPSTLASRLRTEVLSLDPQLPVYDVRTMEDLMGTSAFALFPLRLGSSLALVQGVVGLLLAVMGLYAVVAFGVAQRTREIGIRMALGAEDRSVVGLVVREGMRLAVRGIVIGLVFATLLGFALSKVLYGLGAIDPVILGAVSVLMLVTAGLACWLPARRAARVDPIIALRTE